MNNVFHANNAAVKATHACHCVSAWKTTTTTTSAAMETLSLRKKKKKDLLAFFSHLDSLDSEDC